MPRAGAAGRAERRNADKVRAKHFNVVFLLERVSMEKAWRVFRQQLVVPWGGDVRLLRQMGSESILESAVSYKNPPDTPEESHWGGGGCCPPGQRSPGKGAGDACGVQLPGVWVFPVAADDFLKVEEQRDRLFH